MNVLGPYEGGRSQQQQQQQQQYRPPDQVKKGICRDYHSECSLISNLFISSTLQITDIVQEAHIANFRTERTR
jgi:hypothetical protein